MASGVSPCSNPNVESSWCRDATTFSVALPVSTSVTCADAPRLLDPRDARNNLLRDRHRVGHRVELLQAPVAGAAVGALVTLAEILDQRAVAAARAGGVPLHVAQQHPGAFVPFAVGLEHLPPADEVCRPNRSGRTRRADRLVRRGPTPADSAPATAARQRGRRTGRSIDRCPSRTPRSRRRCRHARRGTPPDAGCAHHPTARHGKAPRCGLRLSATRRATRLRGARSSRRCPTRHRDDRGWRSAGCAGCRAGATRYTRFGRSNDPTSTSGSASRSSATMSRRTRSVAVAVKA